MSDDPGRSPSGPGHSAEPEPISVVSAVPVSVPNAQAPLSKADKDALHEQMLAIFRAAISAVYAKQVRRGFTVEKMARRVGWKRSKMDRLLFVPRNIKLDEIAIICFAMNCEPEFGSDGFGRIVIGVRQWPDDYASAIEARRAAAGNTDAVADESAGRQASPKVQP